MSSAMMKALGGLGDINIHNFSVVGNPYATILCVASAQFPTYVCYISITIVQSDTGKYHEFVAYSIITSA